MIWEQNLLIIFSNKPAVSFFIGLVGRVFASDSGDLGSIFTMN